MLKCLTRLSILLFIFQLTSCNSGTGENQDAKETTQNESSDEMSGHAQSPINIKTDSAGTGEHHVKFHFNDSINRIENLGHTIQLDFAPGSTIEKDGNVYEFRQLHFHTPSEHQIDGTQYPMELHVVNTLKDSLNTQASEYLVIGLLFQEGELNSFIDEFIGNVPKGAHTALDIMPGTVRLEDLLTDMPEDVLQECYHYSGSLTTAPYTESVNWYISKHLYQASEAQIQLIKEIEGENARRIQELFGRSIVEE